MMMMKRLLCLLAIPTAGVMACGGLFCSPQVPVVQTGEAIAIGATELDNGQMEITMEVQILYQGPSEEFSWVLPIPTVPEVGVGSEVMFQRLFDLTRPTFTFTVNETASETCDLPLNLPLCFASVFSIENSDGDSESPPTEAVILEEGSVGPYDFVILESGSDDLDSAFRWLETNGYDQPDESKSLLNYYAGMDMKFVALRLSKNNDSGDIRPLTLKYVMDATPDKPFGCVPIQLTRVAAEDQMPVQLYAFANLKESSTARAVPVNYFEVVLDHRMADWLGCQGNDNCFINDLRARFRNATATISSKAFHTEFAGSVDVVKDQIGLVDLDLDALAQSATLLEFLDTMADANVPNMTLVHTIVQNYVPLMFAQPIEEEEVVFFPFTCNSMTTVYNPVNRFVMSQCVPLLDVSGFDPVAMAKDIKEQVVDPSIDAEAWVESYSYMTRLYGEFSSPGDMDKDPFFVFDTELADVEIDIRATGVPECRDPSLPQPPEPEVDEEGEGAEKEEPIEIFFDFQDPPSFMRIDVEGDEYGPFTQPVTWDCFGLYSADGDPIFDDMEQPPEPSSGTPVLGDVHLLSHRFGSEPMSRIKAMATDDPATPIIFEPVALEQAIVAMDARVPSQVVPDTENVAVVVPEEPEPEPEPEPEREPEPEPEPEQVASQKTCGSSEEQVMTLDFDTFPNGTAIAPGTFVVDQWISAGIKRIVGRRRRSNRKMDVGKSWARLFDSQNPTGFDEDLGSPNENCPGCTDDGQCPGVASSRSPGFLLANVTNCIPQGNILIIHETGMEDEPDDNRFGGRITFVLETSMVTRMLSIEVMDVESKKKKKGCRIRQMGKGSTMEDLRVDALGDNTVQEVPLQSDLPDQVKRVRVDFGSSGAVTKITYCVKSSSTS